MKLELKGSRDIHWENFELRKSWLDYSIFVSFFVLCVNKNRVLFLGFGSRSGCWICYLFSLQWLREITQKWINTKIQFCCSYNLETCHKIYLWVISASFLHFQSLVRFMKSQFGYDEPMGSSLLMESSFLKIRFLIKSEIGMLISF